MHAAYSGVRLIINADDFGLTPGVNRAVGELAAAGALTSATIMATGNAFADAVQISAANPSLSVGCHLVLVDGAPAAPSGIASLRGANGRFGSSLTQFILDLQSERIPEIEIEREAEAQVSRIRAAGLRVTHMDTHKHTHLFPRVLRPLLRVAVRHNIGAIRNPFEPEWSARLTRGALIRTLEVRALRGFQSSFARLCQEFGVHTTDGSLGVSATGKLDAAALQRLLHDAQPGTWELVCHPGYQDTALTAIKTRLRATREIERQALLHQVPAATQSGRIQSISFADLE